MYADETGLAEEVCQVLFVIIFLEGDHGRVNLKPIFHVIFCFTRTSIQFWFQGTSEVESLLELHEQTEQGTPGF